MKITWHTEKRKITDLTPSPYNPRRSTEKQYSDLSMSLEKFNLASPVVINRNNRVIGGHLRLKILQEKGIEEVDVRVPNRLLDEREEKELNLRLNKNLGEWDWGLLADFEESILVDVGFDRQDMDNIFAGETAEDNFDSQAEYEKIESPRTKNGDIYVLGEHRLMCGDATKSEDVERLMKRDKARLIFTDPPYNVNYDYSAIYDVAEKIDGRKRRRKIKGSTSKICNDNKSDSDCLEFYTKVLNNLYKFSSDDVTIYWWFANKNNYINREAFRLAGWKMSQIIIWVKNFPVFSLGQDYHRCYEPCMLGWKKGQKHYTNKKIHKLRDVFSLDFGDFVEMLDFWYEKRDTVYEHPTQKPVRLAERAIKKNSERYDIVLDFFGGSGSTLIACEQMRRKCYVMELDAKFCDVIVKRYEQFTGKTAQIQEEDEKE